MLFKINESCLLSNQIMISDQFFYVLGGYSSCCTATMINCVSCSKDNGHVDKIWKFEPDDPQPNAEGYVGKFVEVTTDQSCKECRLKYGLTDVTSIWLPQYIRNTFYTDIKGSFYL